MCVHMSVEAACMYMLAVRSHAVDVHVCCVLLSYSDHGGRVSPTSFKSFIFVRILTLLYTAVGSREADHPVASLWKGIQSV